MQYIAFVASPGICRRGARNATHASTRTGSYMSSEDEQILQRRTHLAELSPLGVDAYPHKFERTATVTDLVREHSEKDGPALEEHRIDATTSGRILGLRSFGKA